MANIQRQNKRKTGDENFSHCGMFTLVACFVTPWWSNKSPCKRILTEEVSLIKLHTPVCENTNGHPSHIEIINSVCCMQRTLDAYSYSTLI